MSDAPKPLTKTQFLATLSEKTGLQKREVAEVLGALGELIEENLKDGSPGSITIPGMMKVKVIRKEAQPERPGVNPFTGEPTTFKAKPAMNVVKIQPLKSLKDRVQ